jgi:hypothetical protein
VNIYLGIAATSSGTPSLASASIVHPFFLDFALQLGLLGPHISIGIMSGLSGGKLPWMEISEESLAFKDAFQAATLAS